MVDRNRVNHLTSLSHSPILYWLHYETCFSFFFKLLFRVFSYFSSFFQLYCGEGRNTHSYSWRLNHHPRFSVYLSMALTISPPSMLRHFSSTFNLFSYTPLPEKIVGRHCLSVRQGNTCQKCGKMFFFSWYRSDFWAEYGLCISLVSLWWHYINAWRIFFIKKKCLNKQVLVR